jgi:hypothetical protein
MAQLPVRLLAREERATKAERSTVVGQFRALVEWLGPQGRALTPAKNISLACVPVGAQVCEPGVRAGKQVPDDDGGWTSDGAPPARIPSAYAPARSRNTTQIPRSQAASVPDSRSGSTSTGR